MPKKIASGVLVAALALVGCSSAPKPENQVGDVQITRNAQGEAQSAQFSPLPLDCSNPLRCPTLGLAWTAEKPKQALLTVGFARGQHAPVEMIEFDARPYGPMRVRSLAAEQPQPNQVVFQVPIETLERLALSRGALVRVHSAGHVLEESFLTGEKASPAANAVKRWLQQIYKGTDKEQALGLKGIFMDQTYQHDHSYRPER